MAKNANRAARAAGLEQPKGLRSGAFRSPARRSQSDRFGRFTEWIARAMGTPAFLLILSFFCVVWLGWNSFMPDSWRFDSQQYGFTVLTLVLSLQASYAAPLILLAQNRQDDRDRVQIEQDRQRAERNLSDTEYLARELVSLRLAVKELASRDFIRSELRALLDELDTQQEATKPEREFDGREAAEDSDSNSGKGLSSSAETA